MKRSKPGSISMAQNFGVLLIVHSLASDNFQWWPVSKHSAPQPFDNKTDARNESNVNKNIRKACTGNTQPAFKVRMQQQFGKLKCTNLLNMARHLRAVRIFAMTSWLCMPKITILKQATSKTNPQLLINSNNKCYSASKPQFIGMRRSLSHQDWQKQLPHAVPLTK